LAESNQFDPDKQRQFAVDVVKQLRAGSFEAYWAGGCVRDQLLGLAPKDYDVATNARPEQIRELFGKRRTIPIGASFGVITVLAPTKDAGQIEVATFRQDVAYSDGRRPDSVRFTTAEADAQRRDFTINGLFYDPLTHEVIDFVAGQDDLQRRTLRAIGNPHERFAEDKLRMLRAARFAAKFDFTLDPATQSAIQAMASDIMVVSAERIAAEMRAMLEHPSRTQATELLQELGLLAMILPEILAQPPGRWNASLQNLSDLSDANFPLALALLLHRFVDEPGARSIGARWKLANRETDRIAWLVEHNSSLQGAASQSWPYVQRLLIEPGINDLMRFYAATHRDDLHAQADIAFCQEKLALTEAQLNPPPLITGDDLQAHGIPPGKVYQQLLEAVRDAQLTHHITSKPSALALAQQLFQKHDTNKP
jgi:poly(A) polymerase